MANVDPVSFTQAMEQFATFLRVERNLSPRTRTAYLYDLTRFRDFCTMALKQSKRTLILPIQSIAPPHIQTYLAHLRDDRQYQPATLGRVVASLRSFFDWAITADHVTESPARDIHAPKQPKKLPVYLIEPEVKRLFNAPDRNTYLGRRDHTILVVLANTGVRLQELVGLDVRDLDFSRGTVRVMGKGSKERLVPLNGAATQGFRDLLADVERRVNTSEKAVFLNARGSRLTGRAVQYIVDKYVRASGLTKDKVSPHKLRHTFATLLHNKDVDLVDIQALMGHASIASTQIYTHTNPGKLQAAVERLTLEETGTGV